MEGSLKALDDSDFVRNLEVDIEELADALSDRDLSCVSSIFFELDEAFDGLSLKRTMLPLAFETSELLSAWERGAPTARGGGSSDRDRDRSTDGLHSSSGGVLQARV